MVNLTATGLVLLAYKINVIEFDLLTNTKQFKFSGRIAFPAMGLNFNWAGHGNLDGCLKTTSNLKLTKADADVKKLRLRSPKSARTYEHVYLLQKLVRRLHAYSVTLRYK